MTVVRTPLTPSLSTSLKRLQWTPISVPVLVRHQTEILNSIIGDGTAENKMEEGFSNISMLVPTYRYMVDRCLLPSPFLTNGRERYPIYIPFSNVG